MSEPLVGLRPIVRRHFFEHLARLRAAGLDPDPAIELHDIDGILARCDTASGHVYIGVPDGEEPVGPLRIAYLHSVLGIDAIEDLDFFVRAFLPWTPAHELGHHLRVRHRRFGDDCWWEEQVANRFARALVGETLGGARRAHLVELVRRVVDALDAAREGWDPIIDSYDDVLPPHTVLERPCEGPWLAVDDPRAPTQRLARRRAALDRFRRDYGTDEIAYMRVQLGWTYLALHDPRPTTLSALARAHLA